MVKEIKAEMGEECKVNVDVLHDKIILQLPAEIYLELFQKMHTKIYGYPSFIARNNECSCSGTCGEPEEENN